MAIVLSEDLTEHTMENDYNYAFFRQIDSFFFDFLTLHDKTLYVHCR